MRVISLAPSLTEIIYFIGAQSNLIADTRYCDYPEEAKKLPKIGGMLDPDIEKIAALKPDLVLASYSGNSKDKVERLESIGIKVVTFSENSVQDIIRNVAAAGELFGIDSGPQVHALSSKLEMLKPVLRRPRAVFLLSFSPFYSASTNTFPGDSLSLAGFENLVRSPVRYPIISEEELSRLKPDVLIITEDLRKEEKHLKSVLARLVLSPALIYVKTDAISRPSPRIFDSILELYERRKVLNGGSN